MRTGWDTLGSRWTEGRRENGDAAPRTLRFCCLLLSLFSVALAAKRAARAARFKAFKPFLSSSPLTVAAARAARLRVTSNCKALVDSGSSSAEGSLSEPESPPTRAVCRPSEHQPRSTARVPVSSQGEPFSSRPKFSDREDSRAGGARLRRGRFARRQQALQRDARDRANILR